MDADTICTHAHYLFATHLHTAHLAAKYGDVAEEVRQRKLCATFLVLDDAVDKHATDARMVTAFGRWASASTRTYWAWAAL